MGNVMAYSGITTKVRAMSAKLLAAEDYDTIAGLGTVTEAIEYLKDKTAYAPYVNRMDISLYHRGNVEKILYPFCRNETEDILKIILETL